MPDPGTPFDPEAHYDAIQADLSRLRDEVEFALYDAMQDAGIKLHSVTARVKDRASYLEKIVRKSYENPLEQVEDLVGARAVCLFTTDLPRMREAVASVFDIVSEDDKIASAPVDTFGYMSVHYVCTLKEGTRGPRYKGLQGMKFEVQCRTILMDAWANVSHYLAYKGEASVPEELRRDFNALAGLFVVADKHFELLYQDSEKSEAAARKAFSGKGGVAKKGFDLPINLSTMLAYLGSRFPDRKTGGSGAVSEFVQEVTNEGITSIADLDAILTPMWDVALAYEVENPPYTKREEPTKFLAVGLARMALGIARPDYARYVLGGSLDTTLNAFSSSHKVEKE